MSPKRVRQTSSRTYVAVRNCAVAAAFLALVCISSNAQGAPDPKPSDEPALPEDSWHFIVSGDSRNCGDIVMPAIAAHSTQFKPKLYWHLGDLRAIYKIDEDMVAAAAHKGETLSCKTYYRRAWNDFVENQIAPFGDLPFYPGIGNHEVITPKTEAAFKRQFYDWLDQPALASQRYFDNEPAEPETYYHWVQGGVDFIYLDNANGFFSEEQLTWFFKRLSDAKYSKQVNSLVVGMHEALPDSIANDHSMGDGSDPRGRATGEAVYEALLALSTDPKNAKPVYVLASHAHVYLDNIFNTPTLKTSKLNPSSTRPVLEGWIVGTGGAERYLMPNGSSWLEYGYLLATVTKKSGQITFKFEPVSTGDVPASVQAQYPPDLIPWCFQSNAKGKPAHPKYSSQSCP